MISLAVGQFAMKEALCRAAIDRFTKDAEGVFVLHASVHALREVFSRQDSKNVHTSLQQYICKN